MHKVTIEIGRDLRHWSGWGFVLDKWGAPDGKQVMDALVEWCRANPEARVYRHQYWATEENRDKEPSLVKTDCSDRTKVHYCDRVHYLDIYWQSFPAA